MPLCETPIAAGEGVVIKRGEKIPDELWKGLSLRKKEDWYDKGPAFDDRSPKVRAAEKKAAKEEGDAEDQLIAEMEKTVEKDLSPEPPKVEKGKK